jgi:hypothetical protein
MSWWTDIRDSIGDRIKREWDRLLEKITGVKTDKPKPPPSGTPAEPTDGWTPARSRWVGPNFTGATRDERVTLRSASIDAGGHRLSLDYDPLPSDWPKQVNAPGMLCLFTKQADGLWLGGKFEWLDPGQKTKHLNNIDKGYNGWQRPAKGAETAVVIFQTRGARHSNPAYTRYGQ